MPRAPFKTTVLGIIVLGMLSSWLANHLKLIPISSWFGHPPATPTPTPTPRRDQWKTNIKVERMDPRKEQLAEQYDSFNSRFSAVEASLQKRASDLGNLPIKPEIAASIQTTRSDLAEAHGALAQGDLDRAAGRLKRVEESLKYLESL